MTMPDLFGEKRIQLKHADNYLNNIAQHIYDIVNRTPEVLDGKSMNEINRKIHLELMFDAGLALILAKEKCFTEFREWYLSKACPTEEETARALREMLSEDIIRLPASVIKKSEQFKARIASKMR